MHPAKAVVIVLGIVFFLGFIALKLEADWKKRKEAALSTEGTDLRDREITNKSGILWVEYIVTEKSPYSRRTILYMNDGETIFICGWVTIPAGGCVDTLGYRRILKLGTATVYQELGCAAYAPDNWVKRWEMTYCNFDGTE